MARITRATLGVRVELTFDNVELVTVRLTSAALRRDFASRSETPGICRQGRTLYAWDVDDWDVSEKARRALRNRDDATIFIHEDQACALFGVAL